MSARLRCRWFIVDATTQDPHELHDLARSTDPVHVAEVQKWRGRMAKQFLDEGRDKCVSCVNIGFGGLVQLHLGSAASLVEHLLWNIPSRSLLDAVAAHKKCKFNTSQAISDRL